jgi:cell division protein FtsB
MGQTRFADQRGAGWGQVALTAGLLLALFYIGQNTLAGRHGLLALIESRQEINLLEVELAQVESERAIIARDVQLLSPPYVDQDLLDERARSELGYARAGELVIFRDQEQD